MVKRLHLPVNTLWWGKRRFDIRGNARSLTGRRCLNRWIAAPFVSAAGIAIGPRPTLVDAGISNV